MFEYPAVAEAPRQQTGGVFYLRGVLTFFLSTFAFVFLLLANLSGAPAPFVRNLFFSKIEDEYAQYFWTMYNFCTYNGNELTGTGTCSITQAAYPYEPYRWASDITNPSAYKNGSKAAYAFILMALLITLMANLVALAAFFKRSCQLYSAFRFMTAFAFFLIFVGAVIVTTIHRSGLAKIVQEGTYSGRMGKTMIAFIWLPVVFQGISLAVAYFWKSSDQGSQREIPMEEMSHEKNPFDSSRSHL